MTDPVAEAALKAATAIRQAQMSVTLDNATDDEILHQIDLRGLYPGVNDNDIVMLMEAWLRKDSQALGAVIKHMCIRHLGIVI